MSRSAFDGDIPDGTFFLVWEQQHMGGSHDECMRLKARDEPAAWSEAAQALAEMDVDPDFPGSIDGIYGVKLVRISYATEWKSPDKWPALHESRRDVQRELEELRESSNRDRRRREYERLKAEFEP